ncbi:erythropoietin receptor [Clupea harengus]|uniref:Erythropoietin receptor n=1 Tax=Clupea harengus TaxID=7950 RepID=A0A8M1KIT8_CLUHA|nr:erythropoietin receptor [Clupea harengus]
MTYVSLAKVLAFCSFLCISKDACVEGSRELETKVKMLLRSEEENPKCFLKGTVEIFCFWEEQGEDNGTTDQYTFRFTYLGRNTTVCPVKVLSIGDGKKMYSCENSQVIWYSPLDIKVFRGEQLIYERSSLFTDQMFLLDPPGNMTLRRTAKPGQLKVTWLPPDFIDDGLLYEISYAVTGSQMGKREQVRFKTDLLLQGLQAGINYSVKARVRPQSSGFKGWWSAWTDPVTVILPNETDPLIVSMSLIISLILLLLSLSILLTHRSFLLKKLWPVIPSPESKFPDLFTVYKGDFQEWMNHNPGGMRWIPAYYYTDEPVAPLEVLSEINIGAALPSLISPHRDPQAMEADGARQLDEGDQVLNRVSPQRWSELQHEAWMLEHLRNLPLHPPPLSQSSLLESHDAYVSLNHSSQKPKDEEKAQEREGDEMEDILEESLPLQTLFAGAGTRSSTSHSDLGSLQQSSGSGRLSSQCSFEYPNQTWPPNGPNYTYMAVADSGVSMDYSPMSSSQLADTERKHKPRVIYTNELPLIHKHKHWPLTRQPTDSDCRPLGHQA